MPLTMPERKTLTIIDTSFNLRKKPVNSICDGSGAFLRLYFLLDGISPKKKEIVFNQESPKPLAKKGEIVI